MKLSVSNIGWKEDDDQIVFDKMAMYGFSGVEIAPTRIFVDNPYDKIGLAKKWAKELKEKYCFDVPSMQSIWYGKQQNLFGTEKEREDLVQYTKKAIDFAESIKCKNLVFGCPKNRNLPDGADENIAVEFFREIGNYAHLHNTVIGMEANPTIYNTNYINDTSSALDLILQVNSKGFLLNLDIGTLIQNEESVQELIGKVHLINHVHISEPGLAPIKQRTMHEQLCDILKNEGYKGYISIEMGKTDKLDELFNSMKYIMEVFQ